MELFWKAVASVLISVILVLTLGKQERDISVLLAIAVCCATGMAALQLLEPLLDFLYSLQALTYLDSSILKILYKLVGISLVCEITSTVCADAGYSSFGKSIQFLTSAAILYLSVPILRMFVTLIQDIMGGI